MTVPAGPAAPLFPGVTLGMISWKAHRTVAHTFASYERAGILDLCGARRFHFIEISDADRAVGGHYGFTVSGSGENAGIFGAVDTLAAATTTPYLLQVENDCPVIADRAHFIAMMTTVLDDMRTGHVPVFLMRSRREPGDSFARRTRYENKFRIMWPIGSPASERRPLPNPVVRLYEDVRRSALRGAAIYAEEDPSLRHPGIIQRTDNGHWITSAPYLQWSNNSYLVETRFLRDVVLDRVRRHPARTTLNGSQDIEAALKEGHWWRRQSIPIGQCEPGPFTHQRLDR